MNYLNIIKAVVKKDMKEFLRNRTIIIVILLPLLASLFFLTIENAGLNKNFNIGIVDQINSDFDSYISQNIANINIDKYEDIEQGKEDIGDNINGLIRIIKEDEYELFLDASNSNLYFFLQNQIEGIIENYLNIKPNYILKVTPINQISGRLNFLPIWITITITMIGVLIISGNLAEEKENKTLDSVYIAPAYNYLFLIGKIFSGVILSTLTAFFMLLINGFYKFPISNILLALFTIVLSSFVFSIIGLIIGIKTDSQSQARSIGTVIYFPLLFPTLIYNLSDITEKIAKVFPTYYPFIIFNNILSINSDYEIIWYNLSILTSFLILFLIILFYFFKRLYQ